MAWAPSKPVFQSVVDLGLRDVGVESDPRRLAARLGKASVAILALLILSAIALCVIVAWTGAGKWVLMAFPLAWAAGVGALAVRMAKRSAPVAVKDTAEGTNQSTWLVIAPFVLLALVAILAWEPYVIPVVVLNAVMTVVLWRNRGRFPEILSRVRALLAADETVLGDGIGVVRGVRSRHDAFRLIVATDRRLLLSSSTRSTERFPIVNAPYRLVSRFDIEWKFRGRVGVLSLTVEGVDGAPAETHVIGSIAPANLVSIAVALQSQGVHTDDPASVVDAARAWEEAKRGQGPPQRLLDRAAMSTREFDRGLWLLLGLSALTFYVNPFGVGLGVSRSVLPVLAIVPVLCVICGYVSGTRSSLAYLAPLNLLVAPAFFVADTNEVIAAMVVLSALATIGLWAGSALRRSAATSPGRPAARGSLRYAISGLGMVRLSAVLLAAVAALVVTASAAGYELSTLRLAVDEVTDKQVRVDGRSNLTGNAASLTYTPAPDLREFITDEDWGAGPNDGARWELRSSFTGGYNVVSLAHYIFEPRLDNAAAVAEFVADKDGEHAKSAGFRVPHKERVVDGRRGYVWTHIGRGGFWLYSAWFPQPVHSVRLECVARQQTDRFKRLCEEAIGSLEFD